MFLGDGAVQVFLLLLLIFFLFSSPKLIPRKKKFIYEEYEALCVCVCVFICVYTCTMLIFLSEWTTSTTFPIIITHKKHHHFVIIVVNIILITLTTTTIIIIPRGHQFQVEIVGRLTTCALATCVSRRSSCVTRRTTAATTRMKSAAVSSAHLYQDFALLPNTQLKKKILLNITLDFSKNQS